MKHLVLLCSTIGFLLAGCAGYYGAPGAYLLEGEPPQPIIIAPGVPVVYATPMGYSPPIIWQPVPVMVSQPVVSVPTADAVPPASPPPRGRASKVGYPK